MVLVDDILDLAKFDSNRFLLNISKFKLREVIEEINYIFKFQCDEKHLAFNILCDPEVVDSYFCSDSKRIKQVLINLISNSFKFTENGGIRIEISDYVHHRKKYLKFSVTDTGIGIHKDDIPKLFAMFGMIRKNNSSQLNKCGSGIGLCISKKIVESLGGKITCESEDGKWTCFTFSIKNMPELVKEEHHSAQLIKKESIESFDECNIKLSNDESEQNHHKDVLQTFREEKCLVSRRIFNSTQKLDKKLKED